MTLNSLLFYIVYLGQILVISLYLPARVLRRARALIERFPPSAYPKLYPEPPGKLGTRLRLYRNLNAVLALLGFGLLAAAWLSGYAIDSVNDADPIAVGFTILQISPFLLLASAEADYFRRMREAARARIRTAELKARRPFDFVPPALLGAAVSLYFVAIVVLLYLGGLRWGPIAQVANMTICNLLLAGLIVWNLYGRKQDPHQAREDRARQTRLVVKIMLVLSMLLSLFMIVSSLLNALELDHYGPLLTSLFVQLVFVISAAKFLSIRFDQASFEVYRGDTSSAATSS